MLPAEIHNLILHYVTSMISWELKQVMQTDQRHQATMSHLSAYHECCLFNGAFNPKLCLAVARYYRLGGGN